MKHTVIVTGGSKGIGRATLQTFIKNKYQAINISRSPSNLPGCKDIKADFSNLDWVAPVERDLKIFLNDSKQTVLVHNACKHVGDRIQDMNPDQVQQAMHVNIISPSQLNKITLPFLKTGSSVIYIGSTLSEKAVPGSATYIISKHASLGMMRATTQDLYGQGIHSACICPGFTDTEMLRGHIGDNQDALKAIQAMSSYNRLVEPSEIADIIYFTSQTPSLNGTVIHANLGQIEK